MFVTKHHGLGNDFLIALDEVNERALAVDGALARDLCDRRTGVGADGLIHGRRPTTEQAAAGIDVVFVLFNSDGSRAEMSGNGIRCLGHAVARARGVDEVTVMAASDVGPRSLEVRSGSSAVADVLADMGRAGVGPAVPAPLSESLPEQFGTVDMGNPHLVLLVDDPAAVDLATEGAWLESQFPEGVNVEFIAAEAVGSRVDLRVWERGAGITQACGTGACAAAYLAHRWELVGDHVTVVMPGGEAEVVLGDDDAVSLRSPVVWVADLTVADREEA